MIGEIIWSEKWHLILSTSSDAVGSLKWGRHYLRESLGEMLWRINDNNPRYFWFWDYELPNESALDLLTISLIVNGVSNGKWKIV